jgi:hypothetical protein
MPHPSTRIAPAAILALALAGPSAHAAKSVYLSVVNRSQKIWIVGRVGDTGGGQAKVEKAFKDLLGNAIPSGGPVPLNFPVVIPLNGAQPSSCVIQLEGKEKESAIIRVMDSRGQIQDFTLSLKGKGSLEPAGKLQKDALLAVEASRSLTGMAVITIQKDDF